MGTAYIDISTSKRPGVFAIVDQCDFEFLNQWRWRISDSGYAVRTLKADGKEFLRYMHRIIVDVPDTVAADHINGDTLDNRRANLRAATVRQNCLNRSKNEKRAHGVTFKGVYKNSNATTFTARIKVGEKSTYLGSFTTQEEAARAYDAAARMHHGDFAKLNFPDSESAWPNGEQLSDKIPDERPSDNQNRQKVTTSVDI